MQEPRRPRVERLGARAGRGEHVGVHSSRDAGGHLGHTRVAAAEECRRDPRKRALCSGVAAALQLGVPEAVRPGKRAERRVAHRGAAVLAALRKLLQQRGGHRVAQRLVVKRADRGGDRGACALVGVRQARGEHRDELLGELRVLHKHVRRARDPLGAHRGAPVRGAREPRTPGGREHAGDAAGAPLGAKRRHMPKHGTERVRGKVAHLHHLRTELLLELRHHADQQRRRRGTHPHNVHVHPLERRAARRGILVLLVLRLGDRL